MRESLERLQMIVTELHPIDEPGDALAARRGWAKVHGTSVFTRADALRLRAAGRGFTVWMTMESGWGPPWPPRAKRMPPRYG
jgi:hypothetical protein